MEKLDNYLKNHDIFESKESMEEFRITIIKYKIEALLIMYLMVLLTPLVNIIYLIFSDIDIISKLCLMLFVVYTFIAGRYLVLLNKNDTTTKSLADRIRCVIYWYLTPSVLLLAILYIRRIDSDISYFLLNINLIVQAIPLIIKDGGLKNDVKEYNEFIYKIDLYLKGKELELKESNRKEG